jgi:hypothetical protein
MRITGSSKRWSPNRKALGLLGLCCNSSIFICTLHTSFYHTHTFIAMKKIFKIFCVN